MKLFFQNIKFVILGIVVAIGVSYAYAASVFPPTATPPAGNLPLPVNQLPGAQVKTGGLTVGGFAALQNSTLKQDAFFRGVLKGAPQGGTFSRVTMGSTQSPVTATVNGKITNNLSLGSDDIVSSSNQTVCGDTDGHIILCAGGQSQGQTIQLRRVLKSWPYAGYFDVEASLIYVDTNITTPINIPGGYELDFQYGWNESNGTFHGEGIGKVILPSDGRPTTKRIYLTDSGSSLSFVKPLRNRNEIIPSGTQGVSYEILCVIDGNGC